ncbi:MAG TPA: hypothetical protein VFN44_18905 [Solirubrobacteraceae bacterium]|nr:hypothetical protein [Solirubrobacteraceae bacterium]
MRKLEQHPHHRHLRARAAAAVIAAAALAAAAATASAHDGPSVRSDAPTVSPGHRYVLRGEGWFVGPRCGARVSVSQREAHGVRVGSARIRDNGTFSFSDAVPHAARRGTRILLDVTQSCDGAGSSRTVSLKIARDRHGCGRPLAGADTAYDITVIGGLGCAAGENAIGLFIDTRIEPAGWTCAHVDRSFAGDDFACAEIARPGHRVVARSVREV